MTCWPLGQAYFGGNNKCPGPLLLDSESLHGANGGYCELTAVLVFNAAGKCLLPPRAGLVNARRSELLLTL